jgi:catechol 2,3-dioxygenase-like lactoylglutathione lyase family enzyme
MTVLRRVARNVSDLEAATAFYIKLGFSVHGNAADDPALAVCLGVERVRSQLLRLNEQVLELTECFPKGAIYPAGASANDHCFQHIAIVKMDIFEAHSLAMQAGAAAISDDGPRRLPARAGGVIAFKFRDPDGHPCEFLQFPADAGKASIGYDHSAISVAGIGASAAFYESFGFRQVAAQINQGVEQDRLDGLRDVRVDVVALQGAHAAPHVELLGYRQPMGRHADFAFNDIVADRLVFSGPADQLKVLRDPDGHVVVLDGR